MFSGLLFISLFYGLCIYALCCDGGKKHIKCLYAESTYQQKIIIGLALTFSVMFSAWWVRQNKYIYFWDNAGYWSYSISRMNYMFNNSFVDIVKSLHLSINFDDYNMFLPTIVALPMGLFGYTFSKYVLICCVMFLIPSFLIFGGIASKIIENTSLNKCKVFVVGVILAICFAGNYYAVFRGYIDVAFLLPMSAAMYLFVDYDFRRMALSRNLAIALMLVMTWICRRYTIFFIIGYVVAMLVKAISVTIEDRNARTLTSIIINFLQIGTISLGILLIFFRQFLWHALTTNYGEMYSAYDATLSQKINSLTAAFGYISGVVIVIVGVMCFISKKQIINYVSLLVMGLTETIIFWQTQDMGEQHRMILNLPIYILTVISLEHWEMSEEIRPKMKAYLKRLVVIICACSMGLNFVKAFFNDFSTKGCGTLFSCRYYPLQRQDIDSLDVLVTNLNELTESTDDYIYVVASGAILNCDMLRKVYMPDKENAVPHMFNTCDVDLRDGFPTDFLRAKYIVTTDPIQTHLTTGQEVICYLASNLQESNSYIGCHFECIDQIELDNGVTAKIYSKISEFSDKDLQRMRDYYTNLYPGYESLFANRIQ